MVDLLQIDSRIHSLLHCKVKDFINNGKWAIPDLLLRKFNIFTDEIEHYAIPITPIPDVLIWSASNSGDLSLKDAFSMLFPSGPQVSWGQ